MESALLAVDTALFILIWLVQTVIYPSFAEVLPARFEAFHARYSRVISVFVVPLMISQVGLHGISVVRTIEAGSGWLSAGISALLIISVWIVTFAISVPCHRALAERGNEPGLVNRLVQTNRFRTAAWSIVWVLSVAKSLG